MKVSIKLTVGRQDDEKQVLRMKPGEVRRSVTNRRDLSGVSGSSRSRFNPGIPGYVFSPVFPGFKCVVQWSSGGKTGFKVQKNVNILQFSSNFFKKSGKFFKKFQNFSIFLGPFWAILASFLPVNFRKFFFGRNQGLDRGWTELGGSWLVWSGMAAAQASYELVCQGWLTGFIWTG